MSLDDVASLLPLDGERSPAATEKLHRGDNPRIVRMKSAWHPGRGTFSSLFVAQFGFS